MAVVAGIGAAVAAAGTVESVRQSKKAEKAQEDAADKQEAGQLAADAQKRRQEVRAARIKRAQIESEAALTGVAGSSGAASASELVTTNTGILDSFRRQQQSIAGSISADLKTAGRASRRANTASQAGQLGLSVFTAAGGFDDIFGSETPIE